MDEALAIVWLRYKIAVNRLRGATGIADGVSGTLATGLLGLFALGFGAAFGAATILALETDNLPKLRMLFHVAFLLFFVIGAFFPVLRGLTERGFDFSRLLMFPLSHTRLYTLHLVSRGAASDHLFYYPALLAMGLASALALGWSAPFGVAIVLGLVICNVIWSQVIALALETCLSSRRLKEMFSIFVVLLIVGVSGLFHSLDHESVFFHLMDDPMSLAPVRVAAALPPAAAAESLYALHQEQPLSALWKLLTLFSWCVAGIAIGHFLFSISHLGGTGRVGKTTSGPPRDGSTEDRFALDLGWLGMPDEILATAGKDLRYLFHSLIGKFVSVLVLFFSAAAALLISEPETTLYGASESTFFFGLLLYPALLCNNFTNNSFAWESTGAQAYFLSPTPLSWVLAGKNLAILAYSAVLFVLCLATWTVLRHPGVETGVAITGLLLFANTIFALTTTGNFVSILFPARRDISSLKAQMSPTGALLSFLCFSTVVCVASLTLALSTWLEMARWRPVFLGLLLILQMTIYPFVLPRAARLLRHRREELMETLRGKD